MWLQNNQFKASMKYLLINQQTGEQTLCEKVTIDGFDYYASKVEIRLNDPITNGYAVWLWKDDCSLLGIKKVISTNNPNIDIPQVVDEAEMSWRKFLKERSLKENSIAFSPFIIGYNKSQETHPFSEGDMIEFLNWVRDNCVFDSAPKPYYRKTQERITQQELLQLWKSQQPKKVYYNLLFNTK